MEDKVRKAWRWSRSRQRAGAKEEKVEEVNEEVKQEVKQEVKEESRPKSKGKAKKRVVVLHHSSDSDTDSSDTQVIYILRKKTHTHTHTSHLHRHPLRHHLPHPRVLVMCHFASCTTTECANCKKIAIKR